MPNASASQVKSAKIDCHTHLFPRKYVKELDKLNIPFGRTLSERFTSTPLRISDMDEAGIDMQVISIAVPGVNMSTPENAIHLSKLVNDETAKLTEHDSRFIGLASLPMLSPMEAVDELRRAVEDLGLRGAALFTTVKGKPIDLPEFWPVYRMASKLKVPVFVHPIAPLHREVYDDYSLLSVLGFPFETTIAATRLTLSGLLEDLPDLKIVLSHLGGTLPYLVGRIDDGHRLFSSSQNKIRQSPSLYLKKMYLDGASFYKPALTCALDFWGADKLILGSDYPYGWMRELRRCVESVEDLGLEADELDKIFHRNAEKLFEHVI